MYFCLGKNLSFIFLAFRSGVILRLSWLRSRIGSRTEQLCYTDLGTTFRRVSSQTGILLHFVSYSHCMS